MRLRSRKGQTTYTKGVKIVVDDVLKHYGKKRRSGRYEWGSGKEPYQGHTFLASYYKLKNEGHNDNEIAKRLGMNSTQLRQARAKANAEEKNYLIGQVSSDKISGMTNQEIADKYSISEASVRNYLTPGANHKTKQFDNIKNTLKDAVSKNEYLDVGSAVELQLGVSRTKFNTMVNDLVENEGYYVHKVYIDRLNDASKPITMKVLTKEPDLMTVVKSSAKIRPLESWSEDRGETISDLKPPKGVDPKKVKIRYNEEGGKDKDGVIELRPGVEDLDMGASHYAQVRIKVGEDRYLKGMAVYGDPKDFPPGTDIIFNTNKHTGTDPRDVMKPTKQDAKNNSELFGSTIIRQNKSNVLNIVNEEGEWDTWSAALSSQFLSKQPKKLIKERLDATYDDVKADFDEINSLTNPVVKQHLLESFSDGLDSKARKLGAKGIPGTKSHVILPFPDMKPDEVYAPNYKNGDKVVLVRYPHGGVFELPEVTVNNKYAKAKNVLGKDALDAIGIHPSVAEKLSGADFDGDTVYVLPNNNRQIKTSKALEGLKDFDPQDYKVAKDSPRNVFIKDPETGERVNTGHVIDDRTKQREMGKVSNLITDMTIKDAPPSDIARAVRHSMVVIDSEKHNLDYKQSAIDNSISALKKKYQSHINPDTGKKSTGASTLISRSKRLVDDLKSEGKTILDYDPERYSSGSQVEELYVGYIKKLQTLKNESMKASQNIKLPEYDKEAAKKYKAEVDSLTTKLDIAKSNAPRERQAQILSNKIYYSNLEYNMSKEQKKKLKSRSLARARETTGAKKETVDITPQEWEAIQNKAISNTKLKQILLNADMDQVRKLAAPREPRMTPTQESKALTYLNKKYTIEETAQALGTSTSAVRNMKMTTAKATRAKGLLDKGMSYAEVANSLGISEGSLKSMLDKL